MKDTKTNRSQFESLVSALEDNLEVTRGHGKTGTLKTYIKQFWTDLAVKLNNLGPPTSDGAGWLKVWNDQKYLVKQKLRHNKQQLKGTGGGPNTTQCLSKVEEIIATILNLEVVVNPEGLSIGVFTPEPTLNQTNGADEPEKVEKPNHTSILKANYTPRPKTIQEITYKIEEERINLLKKKTELQESILKEQRATNRYLRKIVKIKEEQLGNEKSYQKEALKLKRRKLDATIVRV